MDWQAVGTVWQAIGVGGAAVITAIAAIVTGVFTGRNTAKKDQADAEFRRELAEQTASRQRVEAIAADAAALRSRLNEVEDQADERVRNCRREAQRNYDLAKYHFGVIATLQHVMNNMFFMAEPENNVPAERVVSQVRSSRERLTNVRIPNSLEDPITWGEVR